MHAAVAGPAEGSLVILLHGFPEFWYGWRKQMGPLAQAGFRVVVPDQRGYNLTDKTHPYELATLVADIEQLIEACGRERACIAGHDWGAFVAWALAAQHPERVAALGIINVPHLAPIVKALWGGNLRQMLRSWYILFFQIPRLPEAMMRANDFSALRRAVLATAGPGAFAPEDLDHYRQAWAQPGALTAMLGWYRAAMRSNLWPKVERWQTQARIQPPTLILWGEQDTALEVSMAEESLAWLDQGRLVRFPQNTHWLVEENPEAVTQLLLEHFRVARP